MTFINKMFVATTAVLLVALPFAKNVRATAGSPQICTSGASCEVGEFLYDDQYAPITTGTCTITSRNPDGSLFINNQAMTSASQNDGWYSYTFTTPATAGMYRTQVCCTVSGELLCVDKSFESSASTSASGIASAVWGYSGRTLSSFGSLASDVWSASSRTLSSFGDLISGIWGNNSRTLTNSQTGDLAEIKKKTSETRLLVEELVNKPIIENVLEEEVPDLGEKLKQTRTVANQLYVNTQYLTSKSGSLISKWGVVSGSDVLDVTLELNNLLGEETDSSSDNTIFGQVNWVRSAWNWEIGEDIFGQAKEAKKTLLSARTSAGSSSAKTNTVYKNLKVLVKSLISLEKLIGVATDPEQKLTVYGKLKDTEKLVAVWDAKGQEADKLLVDWSKAKDPLTLKPKIESLQRNIIAINKVPKIASILKMASSDSPLKALKNSLLRARGIVDSNKILLAKGTGSSFINVWLEEGSIIFKTLATNPSTLISQEVKLKYYLPQEVREEDVIETDPGLSVKYDSEKDQYFVEGTFSLAAGETKSYSVKVDDIWVVSKEAIDSYRRQAGDLSRPLERTSFFAQGVTLKSDIDTSLDKINVLQADATTPEQKIRAFRESKIEEEAVKEKLTKLEDLVTQAGSTGTLFGFVGGAQTLAVWGLIIIMVAGFAFLALYLRTIAGSGRGKTIKKGQEKKEPSQERGIAWGKMGRALAPFVIVGILTSAFTGIIVSRLVSQSVKKEMVEGTSTQQKQESPPVNQIEENKDMTAQEGPGLGVGGPDLVRVVVPEGGRVNLREGPSLNHKVIFKLDSTTDVSKIGEEADWTKIVVGDSTLPEATKEGWVNSKFIEVPETQAEPQKVLKEETGSSYLVIEETPTGWLRVRATPGGTEIARVNSGDRFVLLDEKDEWYQIELENKETGWVSKTYSSIAQ